MATVSNAARVIATGLAAGLAGEHGPRRRTRLGRDKQPHFVVISDATEKRAPHVAWEFEQIHSLVPPAVPVGPRGPVQGNPDPGRPGRKDHEALLPEVLGGQDSVHHPRSW